MRSTNMKLKKEFMGAVPNVFVGRHGYPDVNVGLLSTEHYAHHDDPKAWIQKKYSLPSIVQLRTQLVNSRFTAHVQDRSRFTDTVQESAMAIKPVDMEVSLDKAPKLRTIFGQEVLPHGPAATLMKATFAGSVYSAPMIERVVGDTDMLAKDAVGTLSHGFDEHQIVKLFSAGTLGTEERRKFVPTRWSITAVDDTIGLRLKERVLGFDACEHKVYAGEYFGNHFIIIFAPGEFAYELNETFLPNSLWNAGEDISYTSDYEGVANRTKYASQCTGGYYAARLSVLRHMIKEKRQGKVLIVRIITPAYTTPLGVWVVREAVKKALGGEPVRTSSFEESFAVASRLVKNMFNFPLDSLYGHSEFLHRQHGRVMVKEGAKEGFQLLMDRFMR